MAGELAAEWIKIPDGNGNLQKVWVRDSTARRDIAQLQTDVSGKADAATTLAGYGITDAYTKTQVDGMIPSVPSAYTSNPEMDGTASPGSSAAWARGDHVHPHDSTKADASAIPTKTSDLTNDSGFITSAPVTSVNTKTGAVSLDAADVGALPDSTTIPTKTSELTNDSGFVTVNIFGIPTTISSNSNLNNYETPGHYCANTASVASSLSNCPVSVNFSLFVIYRTNGLLTQIILPANGAIFMRYKSSTTWNSWYKFTGTAV